MEIVEYIPKTPAFEKPREFHLAEKISTLQDIEQLTDPDLSSLVVFVWVALKDDQIRPFFAKTDIHATLRKEVNKNLGGKPEFEIGGVITYDQWTQKLEDMHFNHGNVVGHEQFQSMIGALINAVNPELWVSNKVTIGYGTTENALSYNLNTRSFSD